jgi:hypothetical protein
MMRRYITILLAVAAGIAVGCSKRVMVQVPPRVDLKPFDVIGVVEFDSDAKGNLPAFATQRFIESIQRSQPGVRVLELGKASDLKGTIGSDKLDYSAMQSIRERYGVDAVFLGDVDVSDVRPNLDLHSVISSLNVSAEVDAALTARMLETARGTTVWTMSTRRTDKVAQVGMHRGGSIRFDAKDPEKAYGALVDALVHDITRDFRVTYVQASR